MLLICVFNSRVQVRINPFYNRKKLDLTDIRKNFFSNRVVNLWNSLPIDIKDSTVKIFKNKLELLNF